MGKAEYRDVHDYLRPLLDHPRLPFPFLDDFVRVLPIVTPAEALHRMVYRAEAGVHPAKGGIEITGFRLSPE